MQTILKLFCKKLDKLSTTYENLILLKNVNVEPEEESIAEFLYCRVFKPLSTIWKTLLN